MTSTTDGIKPTDPIWRIMTQRIATVERDESLLSVAQELVAGEIGAVIVASPGTPAGIISERDVVTLLANGSDIATVQAGEIMMDDLVVARPQDSIESVGRLMIESGVRHVPVRDRDEGRLVGLVSMRDVLSVLLPA